MFAAQTAAVCLHLIAFYACGWPGHVIVTFLLPETFMLLAFY